MLKFLFKRIETKKSKKRQMQKRLDFLNELIDDINKRVKASDDMTTKAYLIIMQLGFLDERDDLINKLNNKLF